MENEQLDVRHVRKVTIAHIINTCKVGRARVADNVRARGGVVDVAWQEELQRRVRVD